jgi:hypothetical protein
VTIWDAVINFRWHRWLRRNGSDRGLVYTGAITALPDLAILCDCDFFAIAILCDCDIYVTAILCDCNFVRLWFYAIAFFSDCNFIRLRFFAIAILCEGSWSSFVNCATKIAETDSQELTHNVYSPYIQRTARVTRLGEFSTIGRLFIFGQFFENYPKFGSTIFLLQKSCIYFVKSGLGYSLRDFFTSTSGHPAQKSSIASIKLGSAETSYVYRYVNLCWDIA